MLENKGTKVLFLYASLNSGHQKAAQAVREALLAEAPEVEMMDIEALRFSYPKLNQLVHRVYMIMAVSLSRFYDFLWDNVSIEKGLMRLKKIINESNLDKFEELLKSFPAKVMVCTQALPCGFLATLKQERGKDFKLIAVVTDYDVHAYWIYEGVDVYCVATLAMKEKLINRGVAEEKIRIVGIPVRLEFKQHIDPEAAKKSLGIDSSSVCVLIMGGSYGIGPLNKIIVGLDKLEDNFTIIVVAGTNQKLYKSLQKVVTRVKKRVLLFGYIEKMSVLMQASDLLITKPGGLTVTEALCYGKPMIITKGVRGQETSNFKYLTAEGAAVGAEDTDDICLRFSELLHNRNRLDVLAKNALRISKPEAAREISQLIRNFL